MNRHSGWSWEVFVGAMFIGLGIGMAVGEPGAGVIMGMGIGFILASIIKLEKRVIKLSLPRFTPGIFSIIAGLILIAIGLESLGIIGEITARRLWGILLIIAGVYVMAYGGWAFAKMITKERDEE
jgi:hypothetical protein